MKSAVHVASVGTAVPGFQVDQAYAAAFLGAHYGRRLTPKSLSLLRNVLAHPAIRKRHFAVSDPACLVDEDPDARVRRFTEGSCDLSALAARRALEGAGLAPDAITGLVVNTCTGYVCPGLSNHLIERLGLPERVRAFDLVGAGCGGAIPNLQAAEGLLAARDGAVLSVSVEICSATFQMGDDPSLLISNALFGDGAAAAVLWNRPEGLELAATASRTRPEWREELRYVYKGGALHNQLSVRLPERVGEAAAAVAADVLAARGLKAADVGAWALHTGGEKIVNAVRDAVGIPEEQLRATRAVLREFGNMSSPTVWFVLEELRNQGLPPGAWCMLLAYGAGLTAHAALLRVPAAARG